MNVAANLGTGCGSMITTRTATAGAGTAFISAVIAEQITRWANLGFFVAGNG